MPRPFFYSQIFFTNILRLLDERGMTQKQLAEQSGISRSYISNLSKGQANPSLRSMEAIAKALDTNLSTLLELTDLDSLDLDELAGGSTSRNLPEDFERVSAVLTSYQAFLVKEWDEVARKRIKEAEAQKRNKPFK
ncbi:MAG: helix-turn-helix domain-containing protein [Nitrosospira sp.]